MLYTYYKNNSIVVVGSVPIRSSIKNNAANWEWHNRIEWGDF
jgi:hypothetical protein